MKKKHEFLSDSIFIRAQVPLAKYEGFAGHRSANTVFDTQRDAQDREFCRRARFFRDDRQHCPAKNDRGDCRDIWYVRESLLLSRASCGKDHKRAEQRRRRPHGLSF